jgi:hypothetical protein
VYRSLLQFSCGSCEAAMDVLLLLVGVLPPLAPLGVGEAFFHLELANVTAGDISDRKPRGGDASSARHSASDTAPAPACLVGVLALLRLLPPAMRAAGAAEQGNEVLCVAPLLMPRSLWGASASVLRVDTSKDTDFKEELAWLSRL